jgi:hypothetical protein
MPSPGQRMQRVLKEHTLLLYKADNTTCGQQGRREQIDDAFIASVPGHSRIHHQTGFM